MTRFARAKGSKASNEKAPEDATPWEVMREQLLQVKKENEDAKNRQAAEQQRIENYENFLKDRRVQKRPAVWCDFPEAEKTTEHKITTQQADTQVKKKKRHESSNSQTEANDNTKNAAESSKKKKNKKSYDMANSNLTEQCVKDVTENVEPPKKKKMKNKQKSETLEMEPQNLTNGSLQLESKPKKKKNKKKQNSDYSNINNDDANTSNIHSQAQEHNFSKQMNKKKIKGRSYSNSTDNVNNTSDQKFNSDSQNKNGANKLNKQKAKKKKKLVDGQPVRRKEINDRSFQLIIGGKEVELVRYDGFPIMKRDAERLAELKDSMIKKGIPKSEVQRTMKLERRRAEKALARLRREVCYNCRKGGHNLSDCPELKSKIPGADAPEGVCFKCGSTEHRQFECKVQRDKEFRFATCFICKEPGHIARQCPDNPKGLYPNGGCCKLCGDVTHLRKDCPTANNKKEETSMKLQTLDSTDDIEGIGDQTKAAVPDNSIKKPKKIRF